MRSEGGLGERDLGLLVLLGFGEGELQCVVLFACEIWTIW